MTQVTLLDVGLLQDPALEEKVQAGLSALRRQKAQACRLEKDRLLSLGAGVALDQALALHGLRERDLETASGEWGKPWFSSRPDLHFNLSHSGFFAVCALSDAPVGVDMEQVRPVREALVERVCTPREAALLPREAALRRDQFCRLWTLKESVMKYFGAGLSLSPRSLEADFGPPLVLRQEGRVQPLFFFQWRLQGHWLTVCTQTAEPPTLRVLEKEDLKQF